MKGSQFLFESADLLYYSLHKTSLNRGGSYIDSPSWIKHKGATINLQNKDNECFKYASITVLNHGKLKITQKKYLILSLLLINIIGRG